MIYLLSENVLVPGKMAAFQELASKELAPLYPKLGMILLGSWHAYTGNMNKHYALYSYDDLAAYQKTKDAQQTSKEYQTASAKMNAFRISQTSTILEPNSWSPMK